MNLSEQEIEQAVSTLQRNFGANNLNREVLISVLEICGGDVQQTIQFLQAQEGDIVENQNNNRDNNQNNNNNERLPRDYMEKPNNWRPLNELQEQLKLMRLKEDKQEEIQEELRLEVNELKKLFMTEEAKPFLEHIVAYKTKKHKYLALLLILVEQGVEITLNVKSKLLATLMHFKEWKVVDYLWNLPQYAFGLPENLRACKYLDSPRRVKFLQKKINLLQQNKSKATIINKYQLLLSDCREFCVEGQETSLTSSISKRIKNWVKKIPEKDLQFWALHFPPEPWKELSDLAHLAPSDFKLDWFLPVMFGKAPPENSLAVVGKQIHGGNVKELCEKFKIPYSFIRKQIKNISVEVKKTIASYENIDVVLWYYEELECPQVNDILEHRLVEEKPTNFTYGKLMERILTFKLSKAPFFNQLIPLAQQKLHQVKIPLDRPVVVLGDSSYSMDVAIRVSTIISSLLSVLAGAKLLFFNDKIVEPHIIPKTIEQVIDVATNTKADGLTASACCLWDFYVNKKIVKFFVLVTDEIENEKFQGHFFAQLFYKYYVEVFPAKLVFVSFLENPNEKGRMIRSLESLGIQILQFRLSASRPDLSKLDTLIGLISSETLRFPLQVKALSECSESSNCDLEKILEKLYEDINVSSNEQDEKVLALENNNDNNNNNENNVNNDKNDKNDKNILKVGNLEYKLDEFDKIPEDFICPIGLVIMTDPVVASDGHSYERTAITSWFLKSKTSPITAENVETTTVFPNFKLKGQIQNWLSNQKK